MRQALYLKKVKSANERKYIYLLYVTQTLTYREGEVG